MDIVWEDPPETICGGRGRPSMWVPVAEALQGAPGRWARVQVAKSSSAGQARHLAVPS